MRNLVCMRKVNLRFSSRMAFRVYAYQGVRLPEQYGKLHPHQWRSQWLLEEPNAELRRVLIQGIGYGRICQELEAIELDSWREYTLLEMAAVLDEEPMVLLKMTCPSTGFIHVSRVPPEVESAREAIQWVNWDIDPEEFAVQSWGAGVRSSTNQVLPWRMGSLGLFCSCSKQGEVSKDFLKKFKWVGFTGLSSEQLSYVVLLHSRKGP